MSLLFHANQFEHAYTPARLRNWECPKQYKKKPKTLDGYTRFIADDKGHLLAGIPRHKESAWGSYSGTWDMKSYYGRRQKQQSNTIRTVSKQTIQVNTYRLAFR